MLHRAVGGSGRFRIECVLRPAAMVVLRPSAWFWKNTGQNTNECMLARAARGLPFRTIRVKCLVDGLRFSRLPGCHTPKGVGSRTDARTRWQNDQHFSEITHSRREWPPGRVATAAAVAANPMLFFATQRFGKLNQILLVVDIGLFIQVLDMVSNRVQR